MLEVRQARPDDAQALEPLLLQLGYRMPAAVLRDRLAALLPDGDTTALVAVDGDRIVGLIALHRSTMLHNPGPTARITTLVVADAARGRGAGRALVEAGAALARQAGCAVLELTTALHRDDARAFYEAIGFTASSIRLHRKP